MTARLVVITGMSGAGRSLAAKALEDLGFFVVDNLPVEMIAGVVERATSQERGRDRVAVVVDARSGLEFASLRSELAELNAAGLPVTTLFLDADDDVLATRFEESRRPHPVAAGTLADSIDGERRALEDLRERADIIIDTSERNVHELRSLIWEAFATDADDLPMRVSVQSFGFKYGVPRVVDMVLDVRFLPNPHWIDELRPLTGLDDAVRSHVTGSDDAAEFLDMTVAMLDFLLPRYATEGKSYLTIAVGCTGGRHRSVALAEELGRWLEGRGDVEVTVRHRDVGR
jgi:RNase adapter protein RapZ